MKVVVVIIIIYYYIIFLLRGREGDNNNNSLNRFLLILFLWLLNARWSERAAEQINPIVGQSLGKRRRESVCVCLYSILSLSAILLLLFLLLIILGLIVWFGLQQTLAAAIFERAHWDWCVCVWIGSRERERLAFSFFFSYSLMDALIVFLSSFSFFFCIVDR